MAAANAQRSVHYESRSSPGDPLPFVVIGDVGHAGGIQRITGTRFGRTAKFVVVVATGAAYIRGNPAALNLEFGFPMSAARREAGRWIRVGPKNDSFRAVADDVTLPTLIANHEILTPRVVGPYTRDGARVYTIFGTTAHGALFGCSLRVRGSGPPLPIVEVEPPFSSGDDTVTTRFSRWNEPLHVRAPTRADSFDAARRP